MKKKICIFALLLISACSEPLQESEELFLDIQDDEEISSIIEFSPEEIRLIEEIANNSPKISEENAQQTALQILGLSNEKSNSPQNLMSTIICNPKINTKSLRKSYTAEADTAIYIFNSPDDNGFAILSADLRVPDQILAYSDNGNFEIDSENPAMEYFLELAKDYVANCIEEAEQQKDSLTESICQKLGIVNDSIQQVINNMTKSTEIQRIKCTTVGLPKIVSEDLGKVNPLIKTQWHQHSPYNLLCNGNNAGCVPIAIAQLLVYWHYPDVFNGYRFNWEVMTNGDTSNLNYKTQVSLLVSILRNGLKTNGTTTLDNNARKYLKDFLHLTSQNQYYDYIYYKVTDALDNGIPVFMIGKRDNIFNGHAWIADGYLKRRVTKYETFKYCIVEQENNGTITTRFEDIPSTTMTSYELLHINWGWGGSGNGYYTQNVFDTDKMVKEDSFGYFHQTQSTTNERHYFNKNIEIITDIKPR